MSEAAQALIEEIRDGYGAGRATQAKMQRDDGIKTVIAALTTNLENACRNVSEDLYAKSPHFILEMVQNADDNKYAEGVKPTLSILIEDSVVTFSSNELGFEPDNVRAICSVGKSTKKGMSGRCYVGFKSCFKVADVVHIASRDFQFKFDKRVKLGMITPIWCPDQPLEHGQTTFRLELSPGESGTALAEHAFQLEPSLLLFLRQLSTLKVEARLAGGQPEVMHLKRRSTSDPDVITLTRWKAHTTTRNDYFVVHHTVSGMPEDDKRRGIDTSEVTLAFPIDKNGAPVARDEYAHAFLPLRKYGFKFIIQADFLTPASREDVLEEKPWNLAILNGILAALLIAMERLKRRDAMKFTWFRFLPRETEVSNAYFQKLVLNIRRTLAAKELFLSQDGQYCTAGSLLILPPWATYSEKENNTWVSKPLIPEANLQFGKYLHTSYDTRELGGDGILLAGLGLKPLDYTQFLRALRAMVDKRDHEQRSATWLESIYYILSVIWDDQGPNKKRRGRPIYPYQPTISALKLIPLSDGTWASKNDNLPILFDFELGNIPDDLGLYRLRPSADLSMMSRRFYSQMGVTRAEPADIAKRILEQHRGQAPPTELAAFLRHAQFVFVHRDALLQHVPVVNLRLLDSNGESGRGKDLYLPGGDALPLETILPSPPARFLHASYMTMYEHGSAMHSKWLKWLCDSNTGLGVHTSPRVTSDGKLSDEALLMLQRVDTRKLLAILRRFWSGDRGSTRLSRDATAQISNTEVLCGDTRVPLRSTYIQRNSLADDKSGLPFLPIRDPQNPEWDFLRRFGVSFEANGSFYLRHLMQLQRQGESLSDQDMNALYRQLETRFSDDPASIKNAFRTQPLIYNYKTKTWCSFADAVWTGPPHMRFKIAVQPLYPQQEALFCRCLQIDNPSHADLLVNEVKQLVNQLRDNILTAATLKQVVELLSDVSRFIQQHTEEVTSQTSPLHELRSLPLFPVRLPCGDIILRRVMDQPFYVPDASEQYKGLFENSAPMLALANSVEFNKLRALLDCKIFSGLVRLEDAVKTKNPTYGKKHRDDKMTKSYRSKREYFIRFCFTHHRYRLPDPVKVALARLERLKIFLADFIEMTYVLGDVERTQRVEMSFDESRFLVYIDKNQVKPAYLHQTRIGTKLAALFGMPFENVLMIIQNASGALDEICQNKKIASLHDDAFEDFDWVREANDERDSSDSPEEWEQEEEEDEAPAATQGGGTQTQGKRGRPKQSQRHPSLSGSPEPPPPTQSARRRSGPMAPTQALPTPRPSTQPNTPGAAGEQDEQEKDEDEFREDDVAMLAQGLQANAHIVRQHVRDYNGRRRGLKRKAAHGLSGSAAKRAREDEEGGASGSAEAGATDEDVESEVEVEVEYDELDEEEEGDMQVDPVEDIPDDAPQRVIDVLGEHYLSLTTSHQVFSLLLPLLSEFSVANWTSARRGHIPDYEPYEGDAVGDITYKDVAGELTRFLHPGEGKPDWEGAYPTYHILVKTTTGAHETPFKLSEREVAAAADMTAEEGVVPTDVMVVIRVSGPRGSQMCHAFVDPYACISDRSLVIRSELVCTPRRAD
ncbi:hypothetical protein HDZ31DRAFT_72121 [Schizophyllum fasciatum]